jgi:hypothetical protein
LHNPDKIWRGSRLFLTVILIIAAFAKGDGAAGAGEVAGQVSGILQQDSGDELLFLPLLHGNRSIVAPISVLPGTPRVNAPFFEQNLTNSQGAIFWFGHVTSQENYADVRVGYTAEALHVHINVFDRFVWHDRSPSPGSVTEWDTTSLYLSLNGSSAYRFDAQVSHNDDLHAYLVAYKNSVSGWQIASIPIASESFWRGNSPNDDLEDRGWWIYYHIPFSSLGLSGAPTFESAWKMGIKLYDRDDEVGTPRPVQAWPSQSISDNPDTWGELVFGLPSYSAPSGVNSSGSITIRHKLNGAVVKDAMVGGGTLCGQGLHFWDEWGETNYAGREQINIQNQIDVADWPCFSKLYLTFPLDQLPPGKVILSADLTLHQFGNSGGDEYGEPPLSLIQVLTVAEDWEENTLNWNNAPRMLENVSRAWVEPVQELADWRGLPRTWDISLALAQAYQARQPLRLVLYSADAPMHTGKYFFSSKVDDYSAQSRPTLTVVWGNP